VDQLSLEYFYHKSYNGFWNQISKKLAPVTKGRPFQEWAEQVSDQLYTTCLAGSSHVNPEKYFSATKIGACKYNKDISVHARLINNQKEFLIELKDYGVNNNVLFHRFLIAHEIAHTFLFDTKRVPFMDYAFFPPGSREVEFLCNLLARALLLPGSLIRKRLSKIPSLSDPAFSLIEINKLCAVFKVQHTVLLNRLIFDTGLWNCLFLRFRNYGEESNVWRLKEKYLPSFYWNNKKAFIPPEDSKKDKNNPLRYPSAKGELKKVFDAVYQELEIKKRVMKELRPSELGSSILKSFIKEHFKYQPIVVHFSKGIDSFSHGEYLNVCIPLERKSSEPA
jgi:hypothetical protein